MSYDLLFYKQKDKEISKDKISQYLSDNLVSVDESGTQWFFENKDTEVYFSFDYNEPGDGYQDDEDIGPIDNFDDTNFSFNLNFMRPSFFGNEAFKFVQQFCKDLSLFVLNPQCDSEIPYLPTAQEQFNIWNKTNLWASKEHFDEIQSCYLSEDECYNVWKYNFNRQQLQQKLGDTYFVPKIFFFKTKETNKPFTITIWTEHLPIVLPVTDYILLTRQYKKFFRTIKDTALISRENLLGQFGKYFAEFDFPNCLVIHQAKADQAKNEFNSIKSEKDLGEFAERLAIEKLYNAKPE